MILPDNLHTLLGQTLPKEREALALIASLAPFGTSIVELGTYLGQTAICMAWGSAKGNRVPIYTIDPHILYKGRMDRGEVYGPTDLPILYHQLADQDHEITQLLHCVSLPSVAVAAIWPPQTLSVLFIDALHDTQSVYVDIVAWQPALIAGALVVFHDHNYPTVRQAIKLAVERGISLTLRMEPSPSLGIYDYAKPAD